MEAVIFTANSIQMSFSPIPRPPYCNTLLFFNEALAPRSGAFSA